LGYFKSTFHTLLYNVNFIISVIKLCKRRKELWKGKHSGKTLKTEVQERDSNPLEVRENMKGIDSRAGSQVIVFYLKNWTLSQTTTRVYRFGGKRFNFNVCKKILGSLFYPIGLRGSLRQCHAVLIIIALYCSLKSDYVMPPIWVFFCKISLAIWVLLWFHINLRIVFLFLWKMPWEFW
jgi:hypothetical protein